MAFLAEYLIALRTSGWLVDLDVQMHLGVNINKLYQFMLCHHLKLVIFSWNRIVKIQSLTGVNVAMRISYDKSIFTQPNKLILYIKLKCNCQTPYPLHFKSSIVQGSKLDSSSSFTPWSFTCSMCLLRVHFLLNILAQCGQTMPSTLWCLLMCDVKSAAS